MRSRKAWCRISSWASAFFRLYLTPADFDAFHACSDGRLQSVKLETQDSLTNVYGPRQQVYDATTGRGINVFVNLSPKGDQRCNHVPTCAATHAALALY